MKRLFDRWIGSMPPGSSPRGELDDTGFFATAFLERDDAPSPLAVSAARSRLVSSEACDPLEGLRLLQAAWGDERLMARLDEIERSRLVDYLDFATVPVGREVIAQDEPGDFALVLLDGLMAVDRVQPWGGRARLAEARPGDALGELSLFDSGARFCSCTTLQRCTLAVVHAHQLDALMLEAPRLGMALTTALARRLSLRMRQVSARLSAVLSHA